MDPFTAIGLGFTALVGGSLLGLHLGKVKVPRAGTWLKPPDVLVYRELRGVHIDQVREAVLRLEGMGFEFGDVLETMNTGRKAGAIVIGPPEANWRPEDIGRADWIVERPWEDDLAPQMDEEDIVTRAQDIIDLSDGGEITSAKVRIDTSNLFGRDVVRILAHELAHAMGCLHCETAQLGRRKKRSKRGRFGVGRPRLGLVGRKSGHLMHPSYERGGWNTKGMEA